MGFESGLLGDHRLGGMKSGASWLRRATVMVTDVKNDVSVTHGKLRTLTAVVS